MVIYGKDSKHEGTGGMERQEITVKDLDVRHLMSLYFPTS